MNKRTMLCVLFGTAVSAISMVFVGKSYYELGKVQGRIDLQTEQINDLEKLKAHINDASRKTREVYENLD